MAPYYRPKSLQSKSIGLFISLGVHILLLGIILPNIGRNQLQLNLERGYRRLRLVTIEPPEPVPVTPTSEPTVSEPTNALPESSLPLSNSPAVDSLPAIPPVPIPLPPPPGDLGLSPSSESSSPLFDYSPPPPLPPELVEIINPIEDSLNLPQLTTLELPSTPESSPETASDPDLAEVERQDNLIVSVQAKAESLKYDPTDTTQAEAEANYQQWLNWQANSLPQRITWQGQYPLDACIKQIQGETRYGVLVAPTGEVINLHLIQSAGYPLLNQKATQEIKTHQFPPQPEISAYVVTVTFVYSPDLCPSLTVPNRAR